MKRLLSAFVLLLVCLPASSQEAEASAPQRERIKAQRTQVESAFHRDEKACYGKFAVNDCLNAAKARRRQALAELRREEIALNDAERRRKAAERLQTQQDRAPDKPAAPQAHTRTGSDPAQREAKAAAKAAQRAASAPARAQEQVKRKSTPLDDAEVARNRERHEERLSRAQERRADVEKRLAERKKPPAKPLPTPAP